jgi:hypothetical protein
MYEAESGTGLHPETLRRMEELFGGHLCTVCRADAARLCAGEFYCHEHCPRNPVYTPGPCRVYHCHLAEEPS